MISLLKKWNLDLIIITAISLLIIILFKDQHGPLANLIRLPLFLYLFIFGPLEVIKRNKNKSQKLSLTTKALFTVGMLFFSFVVGWTINKIQSPSSSPVLIGISLYFITAIFGVLAAGMLSTILLIKRKSYAIEENFWEVNFTKLFFFMWLVVLLLLGFFVIFV